MVVSNILYFHPYLGKIPILLVFFKGVETTNQKVKHLFLVWELNLLEKTIILENGGAFKYHILWGVSSGSVSGVSPEQWKKGLWLFRVYVVDEILPSYEGIIS